MISVRTLLLKKPVTVLVFSGHFVMLKENRCIKLHILPTVLTVTLLSFVQNKLICQNLFLHVKRVKYPISFLTATSSLEYKHLPFSSLLSLRELTKYGKLQGKTAVRKLFILANSYTYAVYNSSSGEGSREHVQVQATERSSKNSSITTLSILYAYSGFSSTAGNKEFDSGPEAVFCTLM